MLQSITGLGNSPVKDAILSLAMVAFAPAHLHRTIRKQWHEERESGPNYRDDLTPACGIFLSIALGLAGWALILLPFLL
jgi:hypothetical protein